MTSTSHEPTVLRDLPAGTVAGPALRGDFRSGQWTRLGGSSVVGDTVTETALHDLAERTRAAARAQGYSVGWAEGCRAAGAKAQRQAEDLARSEEQQARRREDEQRCAVDALESAIASSRTAFAGTAAALEERIVDIALQVAEAVIGRELSSTDDPGREALERALTVAPVGSAVTVRMHPADRAALGPDVLDGRAVTVVDDSSLQRGDAIAETDHTVVDACIASALDRVREVLSR